MSKQNFDAVLERPEGHKEAAFVTIPFDVEEVFGTRGRVPIKALIDGEPYRGSLAPMGGRHCLGVLKAIRNKLGKKHGETVHVELERDTEERTISIPNDLEALFNRNPKAKSTFDGFSYTHRKEYVQWIEEAKREETRLRRLAKTIEMLEAGQTR